MTKKNKYNNLFESEASEAYIIEEYVAYAKDQPEAVIQLTRIVGDESRRGCITLMALVNALIKNGHTEPKKDK